MNKVKPIRIFVLAVCASLISVVAVSAQGVQGPIDITANEQEFSGEQIIARGNVRVVYKESVILAPMATLYRDATGNPSRAVFTGHPRLSQANNTIDAETLVFEIAAQKIIATGNAHSEVEGEAESEVEKPIATASADLSTPDAERLAGKREAKKPEKIITDADRQEYDQATGRFDAIGHVRVRHGDITVQADKLNLVYGTNNKPETAVFTGNVTATQNRNSTQADQMTYSLTTKRLQATGNVRSKVIQEKKEQNKSPGPAAMDILAAPANAKPGAPSGPLFELSGNEDKPIYILSDAQDYSRDNGRVSARGNVKVIYGDTVGIGPQIVLTRNQEGKADKVVFTGRSQISQPGRRWIADSITFLVDERRVVAHGNSRAMILQTPAKDPAKEPAKPAPPGTTRMAEPAQRKTI